MQYGLFGPTLHRVPFMQIQALFLSSAYLDKYLSFLRLMCSSLSLMLNDQTYIHTSRQELERRHECVSDEIVQLEIRYRAPETRIAFYRCL